MDTLTPVDQSTIDEINGRIYLAVDGFFERYFTNKPWSPFIEQCARELCHEPLLGSLHKLVLESLSACIGEHPTFLSRTPEPETESAAATSQPSSHVFLVPNAFSHDYNWSHVQVIGVFEENQDQAGKDYLRGFLRLCAHAREVFIAQPTRLFLHGFHVLGSTIQLWVFDRSGLYSCEPFDVTTNLHQFLVVIAGYKQMSDAELGISTFIKKDEAGKYVFFQGDKEPEECRLYLEDEPLAFPRRMVSQGPTCYRAKKEGSMSWEFVLKLSWRSKGKSREEELLRLVKEGKVWGVVQYFGFQRLDSISNLRQGLRFGDSQKISLGTRENHQSI